MNAQLACQTKSGSVYTLTKCLSFRFEKERYTPHTYIEGEWYMDSRDYSEIVLVTLKLNGTSVHLGYPCGCEVISRNGRSVLKVRSRGYSDALTKNRPVPGLVTNIDLQTLGTSAVNCYGVSFEQNTPVVNYVNYYEGTTLWDAIVCYSIRATGLYPYIKGVNTVSVSRPSLPSVLYLNESDLVERSSGCDYSNIISSISQSDVDGTANAFSASNSAALERNIIRHKDIPFDREWIMDPQLGLAAKLNYSMRGYRYDRFKTKGYLGNDIMDKLAINNTSYISEISKITVTGGIDKPVMTEILCYHDGYTD